MKKYTFFVNGMHCKACVILTESQIKEYPGVKKAKSDLVKGLVEVEGDFANKSTEEIVSGLNKLLVQHGYTLSTTKNKKTRSWNDFIPASIGAGLFILIFSFVQKFGFIDNIVTDQLSYGSVFLIGLIASVSTCMVVVGSLVVSISSSLASENSIKISHALFHISRLITFFVLGGLIGVLGLKFQPDINSTLILNFIVSSVLLIMGVNLLEIFDWTRKLQISMPAVLGKNLISNVKRFNKILMPVILGIGSFFLPCGFTQSMQVYTLTSGSFLNGASIMFSFALGTLPVLLILSFGPVQIMSSTKSRIFFRAVGLVVIYFAITSLFNILKIFQF